MRLPRIFLFLFVLSSLSSSMWAASQIIFNPTIDRDFLMDGDSEDPARDGVAVSMSVFVYTTVDEPEEWAVIKSSGRFRLKMQALGPQLH